MTQEQHATHVLVVLLFNYAYVAVFCCGVLQCVAVCCSVLQCVMCHDSRATCDAGFGGVIIPLCICCSVLQCVAVCCSVLKELLFHYDSIINTD